MADIGEEQRTVEVLPTREPTRRPETAPAREPEKAPAREPEPAPA